MVGFESEDKLTNALMKVIRDEIKTIHFVKGHGENNLEDETEYGYKMAKQAIEKESYPVKELLLAGVKRISDKVSVLVISGPQKDFSRDELAKITDYIARGGSTLFMLDPALLPELSNHLSGYGFALHNDIIVDKLIRVVGTNYLTPVVTEYKKEHPITADLSNIYTFSPSPVPWGLLKILARAVTTLLKPVPVAGQEVPARWIKITLSLMPARILRDH